MVTKEIVKVEEKVDLLKGRKRRRRAGTRSAKRRIARKEESLSSSFEKSLTSVTCAVHSFVMKYQSAIRKVPAHLPPNIHAGPPSKRVKRVSWSKFPLVFLGYRTQRVQRSLLTAKSLILVSHPYKGGSGVILCRNPHGTFK